MFYSDDIIEEVRSRNDIVDVISGYVKLQRKGSSYFGLCPFHNEKSPSFSVSPAKQMFYCFGCGAGGNVFTFIREYENFTFPETLKLLADRAGIELPVQEDSAENRRARDLRQSVLDVHKIAAKYYYYLLHTEQGSRAMAYLKDRGLTDDTIRRFGLGYSGQYSDSLYRYLKKQNISDEVLKESGLVQFSERGGMSDKFWNRVMYPIMDVNSRVIGFGGRVMGDAKPKYLNSPETLIFDKSRNLYGLHTARTSRKKNILVCEGYMDVIAMHQAGFTNAVASLGTALTSQHASLLKRYTNEVILTYDSDEAGTRAALRAIPMMKEAGLTAKVLRTEPYKDPDEFIKAKGAEAFQELIDHAENSFLFEIRMLERSYDMKDPESKTKFYQETARKISAFEMELERENYIEAIAQKYQISFEGLRKMVMHALMQGMPVSRPQVRQSFAPEKDDGIHKSQRLILTWMTEYPKLFPVVSAYLQPDDFTDELYSRVASMLYEQLQRGELNPAKITSMFDDPDEQRIIAKIFNTGVRVETEDEIRKAIRESIRKVMANSIDHKTASLDPTDIAGMQRLIMNKQRIRELDRVNIPLA